MFGKPKSYLGVDLGAGGVKIVELKKEKNRPVLFTYGFTSESQDVHRFLTPHDKTPDELRQRTAPKASDLAPEQRAPWVDDAEGQKVNKYAAIIREVCKQARTTSKTAVVSLPVSAVFHAIVTLPSLKKEEFDRVLRAEIKKLLPYSLEETSLDYQTLPGAFSDKSSRVLVNAVPRSLVVFYTKIFQAAGLKLDSLEPESMALARSLVGRDDAITMLVDIGAERTNFFIVDHTIPITHHSIEMGGQKINKILQTRLGIDERAIEQIKYDVFNNVMSGEGRSALPRERFVEMFMTVVDPIIKEIAYGFEVYLRQSGNEDKRPEKVVLTGGAANFPYLAEYIAEQFKLKCYVGDPWGRVVHQDKLKPMLRMIGPRMAVAIGLTLRNVL